ncbi:hypothetical protein EGI32_04405 [Ferruginibacter sp. HRS2-29]|nr:hypothetical protein [Ferruginibacter sp. HRS2-29]
MVRWKKNLGYFFENLRGFAAPRRFDGQKLPEVGRKPPGFTLHPGAFARQKRPEVGRKPPGFCSTPECLISKNARRLEENLRGF